MGKDNESSSIKLSAEDIELIKDIIEREAEKIAEAKITEFHKRYGLEAKHWGFCRIHNNQIAIC